MGSSRGPPWGASALFSCVPAAFLCFLWVFVCAHLFLRILALEQLRWNVVLLCCVLRSRFRSIVRIFASLSRGAAHPLWNVSLERAPLQGVALGRVRV